MNDLSLSHHAMCRSQQRGVPPHIIRLILDHHDVDEPAGDNCRILRVSRRACEGARVENLSRQYLDRLLSLSLIYSDDTGRLVTVLHHRRGSAGRRYRRHYQ